MAIEQRINIIIDNIVKNQKNLDIVRNQLSGLGGAYAKLAPQVLRMSDKMDILAKKQRFFANWSNKLGVNTTRVSQAMANQGLIFNEVGDVVDRAGRKVKNLNSVMIKGKAETKRFQMQWLSIMFFGFAIQRTFSGLVKTSLEWVGITELLTETLGILFLPVALELLDILLPILEWFWNMPDSVKEVIGWFVLFGLGIGTLLFTLGQLALGLAGLEWLTAGEKAGTGFISGLKGKLKGIDIMDYIRYGGAIIAIGLAIKDLKEEQVTAAIGDAMMAAGFLLMGKGKGAPWMMAVGFTLKIFGDTEFLASIYEIGWRVIDFFLLVAETVDDLLHFREVDWGKFGDMFDAPGVGLNNLNNKGQIFSDTLKEWANSNALKMMGEDTGKINEQLNNGEVNWDEWKTKMDEVNEKYKGLIQSAKDLNEAMYHQKMPGGATGVDVNKVFNKMEDATANISKEFQSLEEYNRIMGRNATPFSWKGITVPGFQEGGIVPGRLGNPVPIMAHAGERVIPMGEGGETSNIVISPTYYVTVSDRREFETLLRENNIRLTEDVRRLTKT